MTVYRLTPDLKEVVQQSTMDKPKIHWDEYKQLSAEDETQMWAMVKEYEKHVESLPRFPARGFTEKWLGVDLEKGKHFEFRSSVENPQEMVAVAIPAKEYKHPMTLQEVADAESPDKECACCGHLLPLSYFDRKDNCYLCDVPAGASSQKEESKSEPPEEKSAY